MRTYRTARRGGSRVNHDVTITSIDRNCMGMDTKLLLFSLEYVLHNSTLSKLVLENYLAVLSNVFKFVRAFFYI